MNDKFEPFITQHSLFILRRRRFSGELRIEDAEKMVRTV